MKKPCEPPKIIEYEDMTEHQRQIVDAGRKPGTLIPDWVRTAEDYVAWMEGRLSDKITP